MNISPFTQSTQSGKAVTQSTQSGKAVTAATCTESEPENSEEWEEPCLASSSPMSVNDNTSEEDREARPSGERDDNTQLINEANQKSMEQASPAVNQTVHNIDTPYDARKAFANFMVAEMAGLPDAQWLQFRQEVTSIMDRYRQQDLQPSFPSPTFLEYQPPPGFQYLPWFQRMQTIPNFPPPAYSNPAIPGYQSRPFFVPPGWCDPRTYQGRSQSQDGNGQS